MSINRVTSLLAVLALLASAFSQAALISIVPSQSAVLPGQSFTVDIIIDQLAPGGAPSLSAFDLVFVFNGVSLGLDSTDTDANGIPDDVIIDPTGQLDVFGLGLNMQGAELLAPGLLRIFGLSFDLPGDLDTFQSNSFVLASLTLTALAPGLSDLALNINGLADGLGNTLSSQIINAAIQVEGTAAIAEPHALLLMLPGLLFLSSIRRIASGQSAKTKTIFRV
ncbi:hypothetical protein [Rheinheimera sp. NSM]|uniref:hypothetical protein n=1 Tax=Rheinheimera sp. NSM TaxID=3457884 RepID=UPI004036B05F